MTSSSKRDFRIISNGEVYMVQWRWKAPRWWQTGRWKPTKRGFGPYVTTWYSYFKPSALDEVTRQVRLDDQAPWVEVE